MKFWKKTLLILVYTDSCVNNFHSPLALFNCYLFLFFLHCNPWIDIPLTEEYSGALQDKCLAGQKTHKTNGFGNGGVDDSQDKCSYVHASQKCFPFFVPASCLLIFICFSMMFKKLKLFDWNFWNHLHNMYGFKEHIINPL